MYRGPDDNALIWKLYMEQAKISDDQLASVLNGDLDPLLIFVRGLHLIRTFRHRQIYSLPGWFILCGAFLLPTRSSSGTSTRPAGNDKCPPGRTSVPNSAQLNRCESTTHPHSRANNLFFPISAPIIRHMGQRSLVLQFDVQPDGRSRSEPSQRLGRAIRIHRNRHDLARRLSPTPSLHRDHAVAPKSHHPKPPRPHPHCILPLRHRAGDPLTRRQQIDWGDNVGFGSDHRGSVYWEHLTSCFLP